MKLKPLNDSFTHICRWPAIVDCDPDLGTFYDCKDDLQVMVSSACSIMK